MLGCFNIALYSYFDIHRIFDLILFRVWDFVLWWFDIDFLLFDFNFDFILCLSFLFIFLIHFFLKLLFSFLSNFIIVNKIYVLSISCNYIIIFTNILFFISFSFILGMFYALLILEFYIYVTLICFSDFSGFFDLSKLYNIALNTNYYTTFIHILFYFILHIIHFIWFLLVRFFFSHSYSYFLNVDQHCNNKLIDIFNINLVGLIIINNTYIKSIVLTALYYYVYVLYINFVVLFSALHILYIYKVLLLLAVFNIFYILFIKNSKYLFNLNICYTLDFFRQSFSALTMVFLIMYTIFIVNFFGLFVKDFVHISILINIYTLLFLFSNMLFDFNVIPYMWFKKQLTFLNYC